MATKKMEKMDNPPVASSSEEEEEEESGSSGEESDSDSDDQSKPIQTNVPPLVTKKPEADSEGETDSDSNSDPEPENEKKKMAQSTVLTNQIPESSPSNVKNTKSISVSTPESSTAKRSLEKKEDVVKKKMKTEATEEDANKVSGDETKKQPLFQRLFSEEDELALLQGILDFTSKRGDPSENMDAFCGYVKKLISFDASKSQLVTKVRNLKKKFENIVKNSLKRGKGGEDEIVFSKDIDQKAFDFSRKIWGREGVLVSKSKNKPKKIKLPQSSKKEEAAKPETNIRSIPLSSGREIVSLLKEENLTSIGLDESTLIAGWDMVEDSPRKRDMEAKMKKMKEMQVELCMLRIGFVSDLANVIFKEDNASTSGK